jgi:hypothetical protein
MSLAPTPTQERLDEQLRAEGFRVTGPTILLVGEGVMVQAAFGGKRIRSLEARGYRCTPSGRFHTIVEERS